MILVMLRIQYNIKSLDLYGFFQKKSFQRASKAQTKTPHGSSPWGVCIEMRVFYTRMLFLSNQKR
jgi:hypothetical protein